MIQKNWKVSYGNMHHKSMVNSRISRIGNKCKTPTENRSPMNLKRLLKKLENQQKNEEKVVIEKIKKEMKSKIDILVENSSKVNILLDSLAFNKIFQF